MIFLRKADWTAVVMVAVAAVLVVGCGGDDGPAPSRTLESGPLGAPRDTSGDLGRPLGARSLGRSMDTRPLGSPLPPARSIPATSKDGPPPTEQQPSASQPTPGRPLQTQPAMENDHANR